MSMLAASRSRREPGRFRGIDSQDDNRTRRRIRVVASKYLHRHAKRNRLLKVQRLALCGIPLASSMRTISRQSRLCSRACAQFVPTWPQPDDGDARGLQVHAGFLEGLRSRAISLRKRNRAHRAWRRKHRHILNLNRASCALATDPGLSIAFEQFPNSAARWALFRVWAPG